MVQDLAAPVPHDQGNAAGSASAVLSTMSPNTVVMLLVARLNRAGFLLIGNGQYSPRWDRIGRAARGSR